LTANIARLKIAMLRPPLNGIARRLE